MSMMSNATKSTNLLCTTYHGLTVETQVEIKVEIHCSYNKSMRNIEVMDLALSFNVNFRPISVVDFDAKHGFRMNLKKISFHREFRQ